MVTKITHNFGIGQDVYLVSDGEQIRRTVVMISYSGFEVTYWIRVDGDLIEVHERELMPDKDVR